MKCPTAAPSSNIWRRTHAFTGLPSPHERALLRPLDELINQDLAGLCWLSCWWLVLLLCSDKMSTELRRRFLALPVVPCVPSGLCPSDVYVSTRQLRLVQGRPGEQPPALTLGINPYSRYTFFNVPIQQREPLNAAALYPRVIDALYEAHVQPPAGRPYRPAVIMCDDAVMVEMLMADLTGSGTIASVVQLSTAVIDDVANKVAGKQTSLLAISNGVFMSMEKMLLKCMQGQADDLIGETDDAKVAQPGRRG